MAEKIPCVYGVKEPTNINQLNNKYMLDFIKAKQEDGTIDAKKLEKFKKDVKAVKNNSELSDVMKRCEVRSLFVVAFMPELLPKKTRKIDFFDELDKI